MSQSAPPEERGELLLSLPRSYRGTHEQLRLALDQFEGREYLSLRVWFQDDHGEWRPTTKGCSIRMSEVGPLAEALAEIAAEQPRRATAPPRRPQAGRSPRRDKLPERSHVPPAPRDDDGPPAEFDEFSDRS